MDVEAAEEGVDHTRLAAPDRLSHPLQRLMGCPFGPVPVRPRLKVRFEYRFQNQL